MHAKTIPPISLLAMRHKEVATPNPPRRRPFPLFTFRSFSSRVRHLRPLCHLCPFGPTVPSARPMPCKITKPSASLAPQAVPLPRLRLAISYCLLAISPHPEIRGKPAPHPSGPSAPPHFPPRAPRLAPHLHVPQPPGMGRAWVGRKIVPPPPHDSPPSVRFVRSVRTFPPPSPAAGRNVLFSPPLAPFSTSRPAPRASRLTSAIRGLTLHQPHSSDSSDPPPSVRSVRSVRTFPPPFSVISVFFVVKKTVPSSNPRTKTSPLPTPTGLCTPARGWESASYPG